MDAEWKVNWLEQKRRLKLRFSVLTDQDLAFVEGKQAEMFLRLQTKLGKTREQLLAIIAALE